MPPEEDTRTMTDTDTTTAKIAALAKFHGCDADEVRQSKYDENAFEIGRTEFLVLTDDEADEVAAERIEQDLWAFNPGFVLSFLGIPNARTEAAMKKMMGELCEDAQPILRAMIGDRMKEFAGRAMSADGRGHFLSGYDGEENEMGGLYIYRTN
jgi:hypothetical protein